MISTPSPEWFAALRTTAHSPAGLTAANLTMDEPEVCIAVKLSLQRSTVIYSSSCRLPFDGRHCSGGRARHRHRPCSHCCTPEHSRPFQVLSVRSDQVFSGTKIPAALQQLQSQKTLSSAGYATAQTSHCQLHLSEVLRQPSLADRFRQGKDAVKPQGNSLQVMPPRWPTGCNAMPARSGPARALRPYTRATPLEHALDTPQHSTSPLRAMHMPNLSQVRLAAKLRTFYQDGEDQAGQLPACLPAVPGQNLLQPLWACAESFF